MVNDGLCMEGLHVNNHNLLNYCQKNVFDIISLDDMVKRWMLTAFPLIFLDIYLKLSEVTDV